MLRYLFILVFVGALLAHSRSTHFFGISEGDLMDGIKLETVMLNDANRSRLVPIAIYTSYADSISENLPVIIFNHGYGKNQGDSYLTYSYLNEFLASKGYCVISVQHELKTDEKLPMNGNLQELRKPFWDRGMENIQYVISELDSLRPQFNFEKIVLVGHSNGGDIAANYATAHPDSIKSVITLDNLRMPLPKNGSFPVLSIRASDTEPDPGVIPSLADQKKYDMKLIYLANTNHGDMNDKANEEQKEEINREIAYFLKTKRQIN
ncbi:MAG: alpha/beta fold hydrolase [Crocinitomicaceae bacterium]|nr:alpha/beta fold hydrolase [Crocinitomicaceae bacterium]